jgi:hypothetical protein
MTDWLIYSGTGEPHDRIAHLPPPPPWRQFDGAPALTPPALDDPLASKLGDLRIASSYRADPQAVELVNAALYLRRPLLVTGKPGTGKPSALSRVPFRGADLSADTSRYRSALHHQVSVTDQAASRSSNSVNNLVSVPVPRRESGPSPGGQPGAGNTTAMELITGVSLVKTDTPVIAYFPVRWAGEWHRCGVRCDQPRHVSLVQPAIEANCCPVYVA